MNTSQIFTIIANVTLNTFDKIEKIKSIHENEMRVQRTKWFVLFLLTCALWIGDHCLNSR